MTVLIASVCFIFGTFAVALCYAQLQTKGIAAPGARRLD